MSSRRGRSCVVAGVVLAGLCLAGGGCAQQSRSPTERAMAGAEARSLAAGGGSESRQSRSGGRSGPMLVMAQDNYGAMANPPVRLEDSAGNTARASVETETGR